MPDAAVAAPAVLVLLLPWPPSANNLYPTCGGRRVLSQEGKAFHLAAVAAIRVQRGLRAPPIAGRVAVRIELHAPDHRRYDISNRVKAVEDVITRAGVWGDDAQVDHLTITRRPPFPGGRARVEIVARGA
jgi:crossover junction endodeoxyribonuclease RusA